MVITLVYYDLMISSLFIVPADPGCYQDWPLVGFPWFSLQPNQPSPLLFGMVPAGLEPLTGLLSLVGHLGVVRWSIGKAGGRSHDGLYGHRVKGILQIHIHTKHVQLVCVPVHVQVLPYTK